ncbi:unnamed protein product, partial [Chrysoparadoxa australica]
PTSNYFDWSSRTVFVHRHVDELPLRRFRPVHDAGAIVKDMLQHMSALADHCVSPEDYLAYAEALDPRDGDKAWAEMCELE